MTRNEYWRTEYHHNRYMKDFSIEELSDRLRYLMENLATLTVDGKIGFANVAVSPWSELIVKFTHTHEEFVMRDEQPKDNFLAESAIPKPMREASERLKEINRLAALKKPHLIKFGKREYLEKYNFKISLASSFSDPSLNTAQMDDEMKATFHISPDRVTISDTRGNVIKPIGPVNFIYETDRDYYVFCSSGEFDIRMFGNFEADSCLFIYDSQRFADDLISGLRNYIEIEEYVYQMVEYVDPVLTKTRKDEPIIEFYKHIKYLYQREYRHVIIPKKTSPVPKDVFLTLDSAKDYSELVCLY
ncbi:hypothetical protein [Providencia stuartii]|uniref:hypothetical protein n=1 Tax=Providencia stuartii TaxID=588 RepID=UPI0018A768A1|nr:hypothetical protein [Providencia stuartii]